MILRNFISTIPAFMKEITHRLLSRHCYKRP
jgi:hypothetical protein